MSRENGGMPEIKVGQVWRRTSDGSTTTVTGVDAAFCPIRYVYRWHHLGLIELPVFLRTYELVKEAEDGE